MSSCKFIHDEQSHFDEIIKQSKRDVEAIDEANLPHYLSFADYRVNEGADLSFGTSSGNPGIQSADLLAGLAMKHAAAILSEAEPNAFVREAMRDLISSSIPERGVGINVVSSSEVARMFFTS